MVMEAKDPDPIFQLARLRKTEVASSDSD